MDNAKQSRAKFMEGDIHQDLISRLPNEVLEKIVSLLPLKEAARTSVLGHGWKTLWMSGTDLDFDAFIPLQPTWNLKQVFEFVGPIRERYLHWVNRVVDVHEGTTIERFRIRFGSFGLQRRFACDIDRWVTFVVLKRVKKLELDLRGIGTGSDKYPFPNICDAVERTRILPSGCSSIYFLQSLRLIDVNVTGQVLEYFILNCPFLEELCVHGSSRLNSLKIRGAVPSLKHVEIFNCRKLIEMEVIAPNVVDLVYITANYVKTSVTTTSLNSLSLGAGDSAALCNFTPFYCYFSQLETLSIHLCYSALRDFKKSAHFPNLVSLKKLEIRTFASDRESLLCVALLITAAPILTEFSLKLHWTKRLVSREVRKVRVLPHQCLKKVEIMGYVGATIDTEFVDYLLQTAVSLDKFVIDPRCPLYARDYFGVETDEMRIARERAKNLKDKIPAGAEFIIH